MNIKVELLMRILSEDGKFGSPGNLQVQSKNHHRAPEVGFSINRDQWPFGILFGTNRYTRLLEIRSVQRIHYNVRLILRM